MDEANVERVIITQTKMWSYPPLGDELRRRHVIHEVDRAHVLGHLSLRSFTGQRSFHSGGRFSTKARRPSPASSVIISSSILRGIHNSLADRALSLLKRVGLDGEVTFIGGVARQEGMVLALREKLGVPVHVPDAPQFIAALGAALLGLQRYRKRSAPAAA